MSIQEAILFRELQHQLAMLEAKVEEQAARLAVLETATASECAACTARRAADAERQRRRRSRDRRAGNAVKSEPKTARGL